MTEEVRTEIIPGDDTRPPQVRLIRSNGKHSRTLTTTRVKDIRDGGKSVTYEDGWSFIIPDGYQDKVEVGTIIGYETVQLSRVTCWGVVDLENNTVDWAFQKSDEDLDAEDAELSKKLQDDREKEWAENKQEWQTRMSKLSAPMRARMELFHTNGAHAFELSGYGYELIICELADKLQASGREETEEIKEWGSSQGLSGNQFDCAKFLARMMEEEPDEVLKVPAGFAPITGDAYYEKAGLENV